MRKTICITLLIIIISTASAQLIPPTSNSPGYKVYWKYWDLMGERGIQNGSINITGQYNSDDSEMFPVGRSAINIIGQNQSYFGSSLHFQTPNSSGYGVITWDTNISDQYGFDVIMQAHHTPYTNPSQVDDHFSLYVRNNTNSTFHAFDIPFNVPNDQLSVRFQMPINISNAIQPGVDTNYLKGTKLALTDSTGDINNAPNIQISDRYLNIDSNSSATEYGLVLRTITNLITDTNYMTIGGGRAIFGYNGSRIATYIGAAWGKSIVFDTNDKERMKINDAGTISFQDANLTIPPCNPTKLHYNGNLCINSTSNALNVYSGGAWRWVNGTIIAN